MNKERRKIDNEITSVNERTIEGYALIFNSLSEDLGGFKEQIDSNALSDVIVKSDVFALLNHNEERGILARSKNGKGTLQLSIDEKGLKYTFDAPTFDLGNEVLFHIRNKNITQSSFAFLVAEDNFEKQSDGTFIRTIKKIEQLYDVSPVYQPAYSATVVDVKRFKEVQEADKKMLEELQIKEAEKKDELRKKEIEELDIYYSELQKNINK